MRVDEVRLGKIKSGISFHDELSKLLGIRVNISVSISISISASISASECVSVILQQNTTFYPERGSVQGM